MVYHKLSQQNQALTHFFLPNYLLQPHGLHIHVYAILQQVVYEIDKCDFVQSLSKALSFNPPPPVSKNETSY